LRRAPQSRLHLRRQTLRRGAVGVPRSCHRLHRERGAAGGRGSAREPDAALSPSERERAGEGRKMTRFLFIHLKGRRLLVFIAIALTFVGVLSSILMAFPLKFILDKIVHHTDPSLPVFGSVLSSLDHFGTRN